VLDDSFYHRAFFVMCTLQFLQCPNVEIRVDGSTYEQEVIGMNPWDPRRQFP
jgi:hypothetical protein